MRGKQLDERLGIVEGVHVVHDAGLDDLVVAEAWPVAEQGAAAVAAEVRGDLLARVGHLGEGLGCARQDLEARARHDEVGAVSRARDLAAVEAVAQSLDKCQLPKYLVYNTGNNTQAN